MLGETPLTPPAGYALDSVGTTLLSLQPGIGEEALFRGLVQDELERLLGYPYQASGYDMTKPIAAHGYYDILDFAVANWHPPSQGLSGLGIRYAF